MPSSLDEIVSNKKLEIERRKIDLPLNKLKRVVTSGDGSFLQSLQKPGLKIVAEIKPKSPSAGVLSSDFRIEEIIAAYDRYASAISVLTDEKFFGGSIELLSEVVQRSSLPVLCKDFIIDPYQCFLARNAGAQAILLIVKILSDKQLTDLLKLSDELGMAAVVEIQNKKELLRVAKLTCRPKVILINNRNLEDFTINLDTTKILAPLISAELTNAQLAIISASGLQSQADIEELMPFCSNFLIGSQLMRSKNIESELKNLISKSSPSQLSNVNRGKN
jgi:indole-3-glycerol phosphate synthase/phosphoribosylanthranilate isomerase